MAPSSPPFGLTSAEATARHLEFGPNRIVPSNAESVLSELKTVLLDPMGLMLLILAGIYALLGDKADAIVLFIAYFPVTAVDVILGIRAQSALAALKLRLKGTAKVFRDGSIVEIPIDFIVPGDVIVFEEGQSIPADGKVIEAEHIQANEAALTGESVPVEKNAGQKFFSGTTILRGRGLGLVESIGKKTKYGQIAKMLQDTETEKSPLEKKVNALVKRVLIAAVLLAVILLAIEYARQHDFIQSLIVAMTFGMAAIPEEFPLVFTLYLSMGAWRLSKFGVLVKSLPSVETLGSVDVICTDKTGTLTEGVFQLEELYSIHESTPQDVLWRTALMACEENIVDSLEAAIVERGKEYRQLLTNWRLKWDYPFEKYGKHMSHVWFSNARYAIAMKGAVEGVLEHCQISEEDRARLSERTALYASQAKRVLGLAYGDHACNGNRDHDERDLRFLGLLVFSDPIRQSAKGAIAACQNAGIQVKMLTGDHPITAHAIADQLGISHSHDFLYTGDQLSQMPPVERRAAYQNAAIFSRMLPEQKFELVQVLKSLGKVVAMTGDGINDAPSLKLADIGISMGVNATDIARSTAKMILLKNDFKGIIESVFEGRRIMANLRRSFAYLISFHIPVILLTFIPPFLGWGDLLLPIHIVLLEMIVHPVSAFSFENLAYSENRKAAALLPKVRVFEALVSGLLLSSVSLILFKTYIGSNGVDFARSIALSALLFGNVALVVVESLPVFSKRLAVTTGGLFALIGAIVFFSPLRELLHLKSENLFQLFLAFCVGNIALIPSFTIRFWMSGMLRQRYFAGFKQ